MITIVDYGLGNLGSVKNMLQKIGEDVVITCDPEIIDLAEKIILPGVGKFDAGVKELRERNLLSVLNRKVMQERTPVLGVCLGMQLLTEGSEEGNESGLGWIKGYAYRFDADLKLKVPHMGWNDIHIERPNMLTAELPQPARFYFVHSYYVKTECVENVFLTTDYGVRFASGIHRDNIYGVQFHPEKSHKYGIKLLENFVKL